MKRKWTCPSQQPEYKKLVYKERKEKILNHFGNKCNRCGFNDVRALQIDHVDGGGQKEFRSKGGIHYLNGVIKELSTGKYQLLCANCNWIKRAESEIEQPVGRQVFVS